MQAFELFFVLIGICLVVWLTYPFGVRDGRKMAKGKADSDWKSDRDL